jgi:hypothetical protein
MRKLKKARLAATIVAVSVLTACGGGDGEVSADPAAGGEAAGEEASDCPAPDDPLVAAGQEG